MVTIILETAIIASIITPLASGVSWKFTKWLENRRKNKAAKRVLAKFDNLDTTLDNAVEAAREDSVQRDAVEASVGAFCELRGVGVAGVDVSPKAAREVAEQRGARRGWVRVRPHPRTEIAMSAADEAYYEFGARSLSKANELVTRKFLRDLLRQYKDLRAKDASIIIEIALPLSFVPPQQREIMDDFARTDAYTSRVGRPDVFRK